MFVRNVYRIGRELTHLFLSDLPESCIRAFAVAMAAS